MELQQLKDSIDLITDIDSQFLILKKKLTDQKKKTLNKFKTYLSKLSTVLMEVTEEMESDNRWMVFTIDDKLSIEAHNSDELQFLFDIDNVSICYNEQTECIEIDETFDEDTIGHNQPISYNLVLPYKLFAAEDTEDALQTLKEYFIGKHYLQAPDKTTLSNELFTIMNSDLCLTDEEKYISEIKRITKQVKLIDSFSKFDIDKFSIYYSDQYD